MHITTSSMSIKVVIRRFFERFSTRGVAVKVLLLFERAAYLLFCRCDSVIHPFFEIAIGCCDKVIMNNGTS